jgi:hypothetical protein
MPFGYCGAWRNLFRLLGFFSTDLCNSVEWR